MKKIFLVLMSIGLLASGCIKTVPEAIDDQAGTGKQTAVAPKDSSYCINSMGLGDPEHTCSGCNTNDDLNLCLLYSKDGYITMSYANAFSDQGMQGTLMARTAQGKTAELKVPYGFDEIIKDQNGPNYFVVNTNRENDRVIGFDQVSYVDLSTEQPKITKFLGEGFGAYDKATGWYYIPSDDHAKSDNKSLVVENVFADGTVVSSWNFGKELVQKKDYENSMSLATVELIANGTKLSLDFYGKCSKGKGDYCAQYILNLNDKKVLSVEP